MVRYVNDVLSVYSLSYKYHRLIDASQMKDGELPPSEKCALEDDEEEEDEVSLLPMFWYQTSFGI